MKFDNQRAYLIKLITKKSAVLGLRVTDILLRLFGVLPRKRKNFRRLELCTCEYTPVELMSKE